MGASVSSMPRMYQFDEVFAFDVEDSGATPPVDCEKAQEAIEAARQEGYTLGLEEARLAAARDSASQLAASVAKLAEDLQASHEFLAAQRREIEQEAVRFGLAAARKLAPVLISREPAAELEALLRDCLAALREAPHLVVRVSPEHADDLRDRLMAVGRDAGFTGRIAVHGEPGIMPGDGRIDWADGGIIRCRTTIEQALDVAVARYFAASDSAAADKGNDDG